MKIGLLEPLVRYVKEVKKTTLSEINQDVCPDRERSSVYKSLQNLVEKGFILKEGPYYLPNPDAPPESKLYGRSGPLSKNPSQIPSNPNVLVIPEHLLTDQHIELIANFATKKLNVRTDELTWPERPDQTDAYCRMMWQILRFVYATKNESSSPWVKKLVKAMDKAYDDL